MSDVTWWWGGEICFNLEKFRIQNIWSMSLMEKRAQFCKKCFDYYVMDFFLHSVQEQIYLQQMKNSMGKDAYHPLVAFPDETIVQQSSVVHTGSYHQYI